MRGSPPLQLLLFALLFALLLLPLMRLTESLAPLAPGPAGAETSGSENQATKAVLRIRTAHTATRLSLQLGGEELLPAPDRHEPPTLFEFEHKLPNPKDGFELVLRAEWPPNTPNTAVTVEIEPNEFDAKSLTEWSSDGHFAGTLLFRW